MKMHPECNAATKHFTDDDYESFYPGELKRDSAEPR